MAAGRRGLEEPVVIPAAGAWEEAGADSLDRRKRHARAMPAVRQAIDLLELAVDRRREDKWIQASAEALQRLEFGRVTRAGG